MNSGKECAGNQSENPFPRNLKWWRGRSALSIQKASDRLGVWHSTWSQWESGERMPSFINVLLLSKVFGVPLCFFLSQAPEECLRCPRFFQREQEMPKAVH